MRKSSEQIVQERRLRPIYDLLDSGNPKLAAAECDRLLKKTPKSNINSTCVKALKALANLRMDLYSDAMVIINGIMKLARTTVFDELVLSALVNCFKEASLPQNIVEMFEYQSQIAPRTETLLSQLFFAYVRVLDFTKAQKIATELSKSVQIPRYVVWQLCCTILQVSQNPQNAEKLYIPLSRKLYDQYLSKYGQLDPALDVELGILLCQFANDYDHGIEIVIETLRDRKIALGQYRYRYYENLLEFALKGGKTSDVFLLKYDDLPSGEQSGLQFRILNELMQKRHTISEENFNDYLKTIGIYLSQAFASTPDVSSLIVYARTCQLLYDEQDVDLYSSIIGRKMVFSEVLFMFLDAMKEFPLYYFDFIELLCTMSTEERTDILEKSFSYINDKINDENESGTHFWSYINQLLHLGFKTDLEIEEANMSLHVILRDFFSRLDNEDKALATTVAIALATFLWQHYCAFRDCRVIWQLVRLLEDHAIEKLENPSLQLIRVRVFAELGCYYEVETYMNKIGLKSLLHENLGHINQRISEMTGRFKCSVLYNSAASTALESGERDCNEVLTTSFTKMTFSHLKNALEIKDNMQSSFFGQCTEIYNRWMSSLFAFRHDEFLVQALKGDEEKFAWESATDHRVLSIIPYGHTHLRDPAKKSALMKDATMKQTVDLMRVYDALMYGAYCAVKDPENEYRGIESALKVVTLMDELHNEYPEHEELVFDPFSMIQAPPNPYLARFLHSKAMHIMVLALNIIGFECVDDPQQLEEQMRTFSSCIDRLVPSDLTVKNYESNAINISILSRCVQCVAYCGLVYRMFFLKRKMSDLNDDTKNAVKFFQREFERMKLKVIDGLKELERCFLINFVLPDPDEVDVRLYRLCNTNYAESINALQVVVEQTNLNGPKSMSS